MGSGSGNPLLTARMTAELEGDFAIFMTGMRINKFWKVHRWWPTFKLMMPILVKVREQPDLGLLDLHAWVSPRGPIMITYWRSVEHLEAFANNPDLPHLGAWRSFVKKVGATGDVAVWHETYVIRAGEYEAVYTNLPFAFGLASAGKHLPVEEKGHTAVRRRQANAKQAAENQSAA
ncbi:DUF4188 domain-containing protein [Catelliglobosispora koreensis]|uniref:DUF4188 domain-containing protein n=1 Tax=Catelliglobosispora koreensis TaxID=129052 RepID=UPI000380DC06|nr:DUF4188 domain-containing protein [Catelliglobosispora koreensis]